MNEVIIDTSIFVKKSNDIVNGLRLVNKVITFGYNFHEVVTDKKLTVKMTNTGWSSGAFWWKETYGSDLCITLNRSLLYYPDRLRRVAFHEFTHFMQHLKGDLTMLEKPSYYTDDGHFDFAKYRVCPFEVEAREMEDVLDYSFTKYWNNYKNRVNVNIKVN